MKFVRALLKRKLLLAGIIVVLLAGGYFVYKKIRGSGTETRYILSQVQKGTLIVSVSGTGQVSASDQVDIKPKVSGQINKVYVTAGQNVKAGQALAQLDSTDAQKSVRDAEVNLQSAQLAMQKLQAPADTLSLLQAENALTQAQQSKTTAQADLQKSYDDGFNAVSNAFLDLPDIMTGTQDLLYSNTLNSNQTNLSFFYDSAQAYNPAAIGYRDSADNSYQTARTKYDQNFLDYKATSRYADVAALNSLINETYDTAKAVSEMVKDANNLINFYQDQLTQHNKVIPAQVTTYLASLQTYTNELNSNLTSLLSIQNTIVSNQNTIVSADQSIAEKTQSLADLRAGANEIDLQSQQLSLQKSQNALSDAQAALADYTVRAPFDGVIAKVTGKVGDQGSAGTAIATIVTTQELATVSLNEVDAAKVKAGQKVMLTFDAIDGLSIAGQVADIDSLGTVTSGVVTYNATLSFDTQDQRVKPGMSVSASIITDAKPDVLLVDNSAVQGTGNARYVEILSDPPSGSAALSSTGITSATPPQRKTVSVGLSNDTQTEITSGLNEGDLVVTRTITGTAAAAAQSTGNILQNLGGTRGAAGAAGGNRTFIRAGD